MYWVDLKFFEEKKDIEVWNKIYQGKLTEPHICPSIPRIYTAFLLTPLETTRVVVLGQDPYPNPKHAMGLAFSVPPNVSPLPASLRNIFKELVDDVKVPYPKHGDLTYWAKQGILLANASLTCEVGKPGSHQDVGWQTWTCEVIKETDKRGAIFVLWGKQAQAYIPLIKNKDNILMAAHPSPLSARRGFFGSRPFSKINTMIKGPKIDWDLNNEVKDTGLGSSEKTEEDHYQSNVVGCDADDARMAQD